MFVLNARDVRRALPMRDAIQAMKQAFRAYAAGQAEMPLRGRLSIPPHQAVTLTMPTFVRAEDGEALAVKVVSVFPHNPARDLPLIHAAVLALEPSTGRVLAVLEGGALTAIRTGAASGAATDLLARPDARVGAILGAGVQARTQLEAICAVRPLETVWVYAPTRAHVESFIAEMQPQVRAELRPADSPRQAVAEADVVCAATTSATPVFDDADLKPGAHVNGVGSYTPQMVEIPPETLRRAAVYVDSRQAALEEAGEILAAIQQGALQADDLTELGTALDDPSLGRRAPDQITVFKSVGLAVQDAFAARLALENAHQRELGQRVTW